MATAGCYSFAPAEPAQVPSAILPAGLQSGWRAVNLPVRLPAAKPYCHSEEDP